MELMKLLSRTENAFFWRLLTRMSELSQSLSDPAAAQGERVPVNFV